MSDPDGQFISVARDANRCIERLDASVGVTSNADELTVRVGHVSLCVFDFEFGINALSGVVRCTEDRVTIEDLSLRTQESSLHVANTINNLGKTAPIVDVRLSSNKLALNEIARLVPQL